MTILRRIRIAAAVCAAVPLLLFVALLLGQREQPPPAADIERQIALPVEAQASAVAHRLDSVAVQVQVLRAYAEEVLKSPEIYAGPQSRTAAISDASAKPAEASGSSPATGGGTAKPGDPPVAPTLPAPGLDNPLLYTKGADGAIRKLIDDGRPAVFFRARGSGQFSLRDKQRLLASAALDPLLRQISKGPLAGQAFLLTSDSLLRTAPFRDLSTLTADRDLTQTPLYAWKKDKAGSAGVVWTTPYPSQLSGKWVNAALAGVELGGKLVAVVGAEVPVKALQDNALTFPLGSGSLSWLQRVDGVLLAAPAAAEAELGIKPLSAAELPGEEQASKKIFEAANLYLKGRPEIAKPLAAAQSSTVTTLKELEGEEAGRYLVTAPIDGTELRLAALLESPLAAGVARQQRAAGQATARVLTALLITLASAALLVLLASLIAARRIATPITLLTRQVRDAASGRRVPVALAEDSEIGKLSRAVQELIDRATG